MGENVEKKLQARFGNNYTEIGYGRAVNFRIPHITMIPGFGERISGLEGSHNTVNVHNWVHAALRYIVSFEGENGVRTKTILAGGQSGRLNSPHYKDQISLWEENQYRTPQLPVNQEALKNISTKIFFKPSEQ